MRALPNISQASVDCAEVNLQGDSCVMSTNVQAILDSLTLTEKISLLAGKDFWETVPIPEKGVPAIKVHNQTHGDMSDHR